MDNCWSLSKNSKTGDYHYNRNGHLKEKKVRDLIAKCYNVDFKQVALATSEINSISLTLQNIMIENCFTPLNI